MGKCRFLLFSDVHVVPWAFYDPSGRKLEILMDAAKREGVDFMLHAGDFCHGITESEESRLAVEKYNAFEIPTYHSLGNHETDNTPLAQTLEAYGMPAPYYYFDRNGIRFVILSTNYCCVDGQWVHYEMGNYFKNGGSVGYVPDHELSWLRDTLAAATGPCVLVSHASFERVDGVLNAAEVRAVIDEANARRPGTVLMCINGHYHTDNIRLLENVCYFDMNSSGYYWIEKPHHHYTEELHTQYPHIGHTLLYENPPYAIVTVTDDGEIDIRGVSSEMFMGVDWADVSDHPYDKAGRTCNAHVTSAHFRLL